MLVIAVVIISVRSLDRSARRIAFALLCLSALPCAAGAEPGVLVLNMPVDAPYTTLKGDGFVDRIAVAAFARAGVRVKLVVLPPERGLLNANSGALDGDVPRIAGLEARYPNLVRVPEKFMGWDFVAFRRGEPAESAWDAVRARPVALIKGWKIFEDHMAGAPFVTHVQDADRLFQVLQLGRVEHVLYERWQGLARIRQSGLSNITLSATPLAVRDMFVYLHKRHAHLVDALSAALRELKDEGFYEQTYRQTLLPYAAGGNSK